MTCEEMIKRNLGLSKCKLPSMIKGMIEIPSTLEITQANFVSKVWWNSNAALLATPANRAFLWPWLRGFEDQSEEAQYEQNAHSSMFVRDGNYRFRLQMRESLQLHTAMKTHDSEGGDISVILIDQANNMIGTLTTDGKVKGFTVDLLHAEKMKFSDGSVSSKSPLYLCLKDNLEMDLYGVMFQSAFLNQLYRIKDLQITILDSDADEINLLVSTLADGIPIPGLVTADFAVKKPDGTANGGVIVATDHGDGSYTIAKGLANFVTGKVSLRATDLLTVKPYELYAPADFVVA